MIQLLPCNPPTSRRLTWQASLSLQFSLNLSAPKDLSLPLLARMEADPNPSSGTSITSRQEYRVFGQPTRQKICVGALAEGDFGPSSRRYLGIFGYGSGVR